MLRDILTVYFIVAGCLMLWLNFRSKKIVLTKDDDADVAHPHPEQNASDDDLVPVPHLVPEGAESLTRAEDGDARPEGDQESAAHRPDHGGDRRGDLASQPS
jgi:hypothetical protein